jgi:hypothetical protein
MIPRINNFSNELQFFSPSFTLQTPPCLSIIHKPVQTSIINNTLKTVMRITSHHSDVQQLNPPIFLTFKNRTKPLIYNTEFSRQLSFITQIPLPPLNPLDNLQFYVSSDLVNTHFSIGTTFPFILKMTYDLAITIHFKIFKHINSTGETSPWTTIAIPYKIYFYT